MGNFLQLATIAVMKTLPHLRPDLSKPVPAPFPPPSRDKEYAVVDLETTGLDAARDHIIEISVINFAMGAKVHNQHTARIKIGFKVPTRIVELTGITDEELSQSEPFETVMPRLFERIGGRTVMAFNAEFDIGFLKAAAKRLGRSFDNDAWCVMQQAKAAYPRLPGGHSLKNVAEVLGLSADGPSHRAAHDAELALRVFIAVLGGKKPYGAENIKMSHECYLRHPGTRDIITGLILEPGIEHPKALREWATRAPNEPGHMWTSDEAEYINVYGPDGGFGRGVIARIYKTENPLFAARHSDESMPIEVTMRHEGGELYVLIFKDFQ